MTTLAARLAQAGSLGQEALLWGVQAACELALLHDGGRVHGRVGPEALACEAGRVALVAPAPWPPSEVRAPERARDPQGADPTGDVYQLAATVFQAATGASPMDLWATPVDSARWRELAPPVVSALAAALQRDPLARPDALALARALAAHLPAALLESTGGPDLLETRRALARLPARDEVIPDETPEPEAELDRRWLVAWSLVTALGGGVVALALWWGSR